MPVSSVLVGCGVHAHRLHYLRRCSGYNAIAVIKQKTAWNRRVIWLYIVRVYTHIYNFLAITYY